MPTQRLRALLTELHDELDNSNNIDDEGIHLLRDIGSEIEELVATEARERRAGGLLDRLRGSIDRFEGSHPALTDVIRRIADTLSGAGI